MAKRREENIDEPPPIDPLTGETAVTLSDRVFALEQELLEASSRIGKLEALILGGEPVFFG